MSEAHGKKESKAPLRPPAEIEADIEATRERLVGTIAQLEDRVKPANVAQRSKRKAQEFYTDDTGSVRWDRVAMTVGAVGAGLVGLRIVSRTVRWAFALPSSRSSAPEIVYVPVRREQIGQVSAAA